MLRGKTLKLTPCSCYSKRTDGVPPLWQHGKMDRLTRQPHRRRNDATIASSRHGHILHLLGLIHYPAMPNQVVLVVIFSLRYVGRLGFSELCILKWITFSESLMLHQPYHPRARQPPEGPIDV